MAGPLQVSKRWCIKDDRGTAIAPRACGLVRGAWNDHTCGLRPHPNFEIRNPKEALNPKFKIRTER
jgi:hypothetical protein